MATRAACLLALLAGGAFLLALHAYPLARGWPAWLFAALLPVYALLLWRRPACWLFCLPALLPVLDLAPRTAGSGPGSRRGRRRPCAWRKTAP